MPAKCKKAIKRESKEELGARKMQKSGLMGIKKSASARLTPYGLDGSN
jgi:hypothetical protein